MIQVIIGTQEVTKHKTTIAQSKPDTHLLMMKSTAHVLKSQIYYSSLF